MHKRPIIFDFDGVVVDSETLANRIFSEFLTLQGIPTSEEEISARYTGMRLIDSMKDIEERHAIKLHSTFSDDLHAYGNKIFAKELRCVHGADEFIRACSDRLIAIASSSTPRHITHSLQVVNLAHHFGDHIYSASLLERGKPHPDVYLLAAKSIGFSPQDCIAIEDSPRGVRSASTAGIFTIGLTAATHCHPNTALELKAAGAHEVASSYEDVAAILKM